MRMKAFFFTDWKGVTSWGPRSIDLRMNLEERREFWEGLRLLTYFFNDVINHTGISTDFCIILFEWIFKECIYECLPFFFFSNYTHLMAWKISEPLKTEVQHYLSYKSLCLRLQLICIFFNVTKLGFHSRLSKIEKTGTSVERIKRMLLVFLHVPELQGFRRPGWINSFDFLPLCFKERRDFHLFLNFFWSGKLH